MADMDLIYPHVKHKLSRDDLLNIYHWPSEGLFLRANMVATVDGAARDSNGRSDGISSSDDKDVFKLLRHTADAVIVGAGTAIAENYGPVPHREEWQAWRTDHQRQPQVPVVVVTNSARISPDARVFSGVPGSALLAVPEAADPAKVAALAEVAEVLTVGDDVVDVQTLLATLADRGLTRLLTEGGPSFLASAMDELDELCLTTSPQMLGATPGAPRPEPDLLGGRTIDPREVNLGSVIFAENSLLTTWKLV